MNTKMKTISAVSFLALVSLALTAQVKREIPLKQWPTPLYFQPTPAEAHASPNAAAQPDAAGTPSPQAVSTDSLVFVAMTPCRVVDTRVGQGFTGPFGPPSLVGQASRTFPIQSSSTCTIPATAEAYSFNVTVVPPGLLGFITVFPSGQPRPNASTMNDLNGLILANAAIVAAGVNGSVDVFASSATDLIIDINGYYMAQSGTAHEMIVSYSLAPGATSAPITPPAGQAVLVMGVQNVFNFRGVGQVTMLREAGELLEWTGLESTAGSSITQGFSSTSGTHILYLDFAHEVDLQVSNADSFMVHNASTALRTGVVTLIW
jgi:hypothetical protein